MTLQQLEYVLAVYQYRHFAKAAEACGITQSTLSLMIHKLEEELDIVIFDRNSHPVRPTMAGEDVIKQAQVVIYNARQLKEMTLSERKRVSGDIHVGVSPTVAPYVVPKMFSYLRQYYPELHLLPIELRQKNTVERLKNAQIDMAIMSMPQKDEQLLEIPLYQEKFLAYVSPTDPLYKESEVCYATMPRERLWSLMDEICFQHQVNVKGGIGDDSANGYESGSLVTLMQIVDENGGFTILPELHYPLLNPARRLHTRPIVSPTPMRQVSLFIRRDYVRESIVNVIADAIKKIIPMKMLDERLAKFPIRL
ncbi:MAG: hydrogen peroxide-inducible genes activator [Bacteroidales bacterium]|nr:hydrogen peroxide-inducible genes activator [Bacteroidales bacterium]